MRGHLYTKEQDEFIKNNYTNVGECVKRFNERYKTQLSYAAIKAHALRRLGLTTGFRPWTEEMNESIDVILKTCSYKKATEEFNKKHNTAFTFLQVQNHCTRSGIMREHRKILSRIDEIIIANIDKTYEEIKQKLNTEMPVNYLDSTSICRRANALGLRRPHRVWSVNDKRTINHEEVTHSEFVRFIGNRWHRLNTELQDAAMMVVKLQTLLKEREGEGNDLRMAKGKR